MLEKLNVNGVVITETTKDGTVTTFKVDNLSFENECNAEEAKEVIKAFVDIFKTIKPAAKRRNTTKRFHVVKTHDYNNGFNILWYVWDRKTNQHYIKF